MNTWDEPNLDWRVYRLLKNSWPGYHARRPAAREPPLLIFRDFLNRCDLNGQIER